VSQSGPHKSEKRKGKYTGEKRLLWAENKGGLLGKKDPGKKTI